MGKNELFSFVDNLFFDCNDWKNSAFVIIVRLTVLWHFQVTGKMEIQRNNQKQLQASRFPVFSVCSKLS